MIKMLIGLIIKGNVFCICNFILFGINIVDILRLKLFGLFLVRNESLKCK